MRIQIGQCNVGINLSKLFAIRVYYPHTEDSSGADVGAVATLSTTSRHHCTTSEVSLSSPSEQPQHLQPAQVRAVVTAMQETFTKEHLEEWLPLQIPWLERVLRGEESCDWHEVS